MPERLGIHITFTGPFGKWSLPKTRCFMGLLQGIPGWVWPGREIKEWISDDEPDLDWFNRPRNPSNPNPNPDPDPDGFDQRPKWKPEEIQLNDGRTLVLEYT